MNAQPFIIITLLLAQASFAQPNAPNVKDAQGRKQGAWSRTWAESQQIRYTGWFKDDKPTGRFTYFSTAGKVESVIDHYASSDASHAKHFHPDGKLLAEGRYIGEAKDSTWSYYDKEGHRLSIEHWKNGKRSGTQLVYNAAGDTAEFSMYKEGKRNGVWKRYYDGNKPRMIATYVNDEPEGTETFYYESGRPEIEGKYVNGDRDGTLWYYNEDGSVQLQMLYSKGEFIKDKKENGVFKEYYDDEQLKSETTWKKGKREGRFTEYNDDGHYVDKPVKEGPEGYAKDDKERVLEGQTKKREGTYKNDALEGDLKEYDEHGKLLRTVHYTNGTATP